MRWRPTSASCRRRTTAPTRRSRPATSSPPWSTATGGSPAPSSRRGSTTSARGSRRRYSSTPRTPREPGPRGQAALARRAECALRHPAQGRRTGRRRPGGALLRRRDPSCPRRSLARPRAVPRRDRVDRPLPGRAAPGVRHRRRRSPGRDPSGYPDLVGPRRRVDDGRPGRSRRPGRYASAETDRGPPRRARRARRVADREDRRPPAHEPAAHPEAARGARHADAGDQPPPRLHRQSGHRQDHRGSAAQPDHAHARPRVEGPPRRDRPFAPRRRLRRPDRHQDPRGDGVGTRRHVADRRGLRARPRRRERLRA